MSTLTVVPPSVEPVTLQELKDYLRVADTQSDALITSLGKAAREWCEQYTRRRFITQTMRFTLDRFPGPATLGGLNTSIAPGSGSTLLPGLQYSIVLPCPPFQSIVSFSYLDAGGVTQTLTAGTDYILDTNNLSGAGNSSGPARLAPLFGHYWPVARFTLNTVSIDYVVGYGADGSSVPEAIKTAIKVLATDLFENRLAGPSPDSYKAVQAWLMSFRNLRY